MKYKLYLIPVLLLAVSASHAQHLPVDLGISLMGGYSGPGKLPFWFTANHFGSIPVSGGSIGLIGWVHKDYDSKAQRKFDWGLGIEGRENVGNHSNFILTEGYGKIRYGILQLKAGRTKDITGLCDTMFSSGSWSISGNALGIPKIEIAFPDYYTLPFFGRFFAIKASYANGIMGNWYIKGKKISNTPTYLIQHSLYGRIGNADWKLNFYGGFNHQVVWGNEKSILGEDYQLNGLQTFIYANIAKKYDNDSIRQMRVGNHMGSIDLGMTYDFKNIRLFIYRQSLYDAGALYYLANLRDGLNGISLINKKIGNGIVHWNRLLVEFLYTKNQAGETWSPHTTSPYEAYYNNGYYDLGWSYKARCIGSPFISLSGTIRDDLPETTENFSNNRVMMFHTGIDVSLFNIVLTCKLSWSKNYGTYLTSPNGKIYNGENTEALHGIFPSVNQFSGYFETKKSLSKTMLISVMAAIDSGELYENSYGLMAGIVRTF
jgi:hypothetical protein